MAVRDVATLPVQSLPLCSNSNQSAHLIICMREFAYVLLSWSMILFTAARIHHAFCDPVLLITARVSFPVGYSHMRYHIFMS